jgi:hypothetical protein
MPDERRRIADLHLFGAQTEHRQLVKIEATVDSGSSWLHLGGRITLVGVGFWDEKQGG